MDGEIDWKARAERAEKACAEMRKLLVGAIPSMKCTPFLPQAEKWMQEKTHALSSDCGSGYVRREELESVEFELAGLRKWVDATVENCSVFCDPPTRVAPDKWVRREELDAAKAENARLREALLVIRNRINGHGWGTCGVYGISQAQLYDTDLTMINEALAGKEGE